MSYYLQSIGKEHEVLCHHQPPENLKFLPGIERVKQTAIRQKFDLGIILDLDSTERLGDTAPYFESCDKVIVIDHHVPHVKPGDLRIIDQTAAATCAILTRLLMELGSKISAEQATCLLTGIVTDTGSFRFRNTNSESLLLAGHLLEAGGDISLVSEEIFQRKPISSVRLLGLLLEYMTLEMDERVAWGSISYRQFVDSEAKDEDTEGFVNEMLAIQSVQLAALFRETKPSWVRVSLRSRGKYDVSEVAREFGGGGHHNAAGCSFDMPLDQAIALVTPRLRACLESS
jgi:phosphoesterase RecJ-like protein